MNHPNWTEVRGHLRGQSLTPNVPPRDAFWADFRARARWVRQDGEAPAPAVRPWRWVYAGAATVAAAVLLVVAGWVVLPARPATAVPSAIKSWEVVAPHSGVIIMNDDSGHGAILWVTGLNDSRSG